MGERIDEDIERLQNTNEEMAETIDESIERLEKA